MAVTWTPKDPNEVSDYKFDWLGTAAAPGPLYFSDGDTIIASEWIMPDGIDTDTDEFDDTTTTIWLSGGTAGTKYSITNRITTEGGRTFDQTAKIKVKEK